MPKFIMTFTNQAANALLEYNEAGYLIKYELTPGAFEQEQFDWLFARFPRSLAHLQKWIDWKLPNVEIKKSEEDLSFKRFYDLYNHKVSKRERAEKSWEALSDADKALAIAYLPKYNNYLLESRVNKKFPETYLNSKMWNN